MSKQKSKKQLAKDKARKESAKASARSRKRADKARAADKRRAGVPVPTANAKMIKDLMAEKGLKGNYKDHVIIAGNRLINWKGSFDIQLEEGSTFGVDGVALIHKSKLHNIIGDEEARRFWHPQFRRLIDVPEGTKPSINK